MDDRKLQFRVGVMVFATGLIAAILILLLGERPASFRETYPLYITFPDAPSVTQDTPVRNSGILIGRVSDVELLREGGVHVTVGIYQDVSLPANDVCQVKSSLLGDAEVRFLLPPGQNGLQAVARSPKPRSKARWPPIRSRWSADCKAACPRRSARSPARARTSAS